MDGLIGHRTIRRELARLASGEPPPHALLLVGPESVGRVPLAVHYALLLNCEAGSTNADSASMFGEIAAPDTERPCGVCRPCRLIGQGAHPDVVRVGPGDTMCRPRPGESSHAAHPLSRDIRICQVRGVIDLASRFPVEARQRLIIIDPAERLNIDASNALLKTLEEPPGRTVFALVTSAPEMLLETVVSRCRRIDVGPVAKNEIEAGLLARGVDGARAAEAAAECHGKPGVALAIAKDEDLIASRARLRVRCREYSTYGLAKRLIYAADLSDRWRKDRASIVPDLDSWESFWEAELKAAATQGESNRARAAMASLAAVGQARTDLLAQVQARTAFELMLLSFPQLTLERSGED